MVLSVAAPAIGCWKKSTEAEQILWDDALV